MPNGSFARLLVCATLIVLRRSGAKLSLTLLISCWAAELRASVETCCASEASHRSRHERFCAMLTRVQPSSAQLSRGQPNPGQALESRPTMQIRVISSPLVDCVLHSLACISPSAEFIFSVRSCRSLARLLASSKLVVCSVGRSNPRVGAWDAPTQWVGAWDAPTQGLERGTLQPNATRRHAKP